MRLLLAGLLLLLSSVSAAVDSAPATSEQRQALALIGGEPSPGAPWMAALLLARYADPYVGHLCGATLIAPRWLLTAAHCVDGRSPAELDVLTGTTALRRGEGRRQAVDAIIVHPRFVAPGSGEGVEFDNDIALVRLREAVPGASAVGLPGIEFDVMQVKAGTEALLLGWGARAFDNETRRATRYPIDLQQSFAPLVAGPDCVAAMGSGEVSHNMLCAGDAEARIDSCVRDSGGPLAVAGTEPGAWTQIGIVSWGLGCALPGSYGIYTRLARYAQWISDEVCAPDELPPRPRVTLRKGLGTVNLAWSSAGPDTRYRVYYRPLLTQSPVRHFDAGAASTFSAAAPWGVAFEVAVQAYRGPCLGDFSAIHAFML